MKEENGVQWFTVFRLEAIKKYGFHLCHEEIKD
jgi:hypothetical protein